MEAVVETDRLAAPNGRIVIDVLRSRLVLVAVALFGTMAGCIGPRSLELTRLPYEQAVHETSDQQWLRNLVRLRYGERPTFLDVAAITSQFEVSGNGSMTGGQERASPNLSLFGNLSAQFRDAPTLSYVPRADTELTRAITAPIGVIALGLLANTGWSIEDVLRLLVSDANGLANAPGADELIPSQFPAPTPFLEMARLTARLRASGTARMVAVDEPKEVADPIDAGRVDGSDFVAAANNKLAFRHSAARPGLILTRDDPANALVIAPDGSTDPEMQSFRELLRLSPGRLEYRVRRSERAGGEALRPLAADTEDAITVRTRTILQMMIFLSKGVQVPEEHAARGLAVQTPGPDGVPFDWPLVTRGLFHVCVQKKRPKQAALAVLYRGYWYSIDDTDQRSKSTLALIQALLNLQLAEPQRAGPVLTLPVGL